MSDFAEPGELDALTALKDVLNTAAVRGRLVRGVTECAEVLRTPPADQVIFCVLAVDGTDPADANLVESLCRDHNINLIKVPDSGELGAWVSKLDSKEHDAATTQACSCAVIGKDFGETTPALEFLLQLFCPSWHEPTSAAVPSNAVAADSDDRAGGGEAAMTYRGMDTRIGE